LDVIPISFAVSLREVAIDLFAISGIKRDKTKIPAGKSVAKIKGSEC
jgi:hypothetical protein